MRKLMVRLISPWTKEVDTESAFFSSKVRSDDADALLCEWAPSDELFSFSRRKAWYCCEPACQFRGLEGGTWPQIKTRLAPHEFLCHNHPDPHYRVPHVTHFEELHVNTNQNRRDKAIAIVSNHGGSPWRRHAGIAYRNHFITHPMVDLYGRDGWNKYRRRWYSRPGAPANYRGSLPGDWEAAEKRALMANYQVAICLENMSEPHYFTEKFVEAVCAGCVPVYQAHPTLKDTVLSGAKWIDPQDYHDNPDSTLRASIDADVARIFKANHAWVLENPLLASTSVASVFRRLAVILKGERRGDHLTC